MKNLRTIILFFALLLGLSAIAGNEKAVIKTSAQCEECKANITNTLNKIEGVKQFILNLETKELTVKFDNEKTSLNEIETAISNTGYWANDKAPNKEAYAALSACCKPKKTASCCAAGSKTSCSKDKEAKEKACCSNSSKDGKECSHNKTSSKSCTH